MNDEIFQDPSYLRRAILPTQFLFLLASHYALRALIQFVLGQCDGQLKQEFFVNGFQVVEGHSVEIDYGIKYIVEGMQVFLQPKLVEQFTETERRSTSMGCCYEDQIWEEHGVHKKIIFRFYYLPTTSTATIFASRSTCCSRLVSR